jgi:hypothetical protein
LIRHINKLVLNWIIIITIIIIIIIILIHIPYFTAVQLILKRVRFLLTKHFLYTVCQKLSDYTACIKYYWFLY